MKQCVNCPTDAILQMTRELCEIAGYGITSGIHPGRKGERAAQFILERLHERGLKRARLEKIKVHDPFPESYKVEVRAENGDIIRDLSAHSFPLLWTAPTPDEGIEGEMVYLGDGSPSSFQLNRVSGKIALIDEKFIRGYIPSASDATLIAKERGAIAVLRLNQVLDSPQQQKGEGSPENLFPIPVFCLSKSAGDFLRRLATSDKPYRVRLQLCAPHEVVDAFNIVLELPGNGDSEEKILIGTHYDTLFTGAIDNNGSVVLMVKLAEYFSRKERNRTMVFAWCFGHDCDLNSGHYQFGDAHSAELSRAIVWDVDHALGGTRYRYDEDEGKIVPVEGETCEFYIISNSYVYSKLVAFVMDKYGFVSTIHRLRTAGIEPQGPQWGIAPPTSPWCSCATIPVYYHSIYDTPDKITPDQAERAYLAHIEILEYLQKMPEGLLFYDTLTRNVRGEKPRVRIALVSDVVRVGDTIKAWNDETYFWTRKSCYHYPAIPEWAGTLWDFGDGTPPTVGGPTATHVYDWPGTYEIKMKFTDTEGNTSIATRTVRVLEHKVFKPWDEIRKIRS
ncbi:MAG: PKD domain-containing protein [candidate division WOR-3 bacterium]